MRIPLDISHRLIVEDLDTGTRKVFLVPRGKTTPIEVSDGDGDMLAGLMEPVSPVRVPRAAQGAPRRTGTSTGGDLSDVDALPLVEGAVSDDVDPFGASQG